MLTYARVFAGPLYTSQARALFLRLRIMSKLWTGSRAARRAPSPDALALTSFLFLLVLANAHAAAAQSWSGSQQDPLLFQIVAVDRSGEAGFPHGREDVAGDGLAAFEDDEAGSDLRSVYADADASRLWLRAYLAATGTPAMTLRTFFFIDSDARDGTGGPAQGAELDQALADDPTPGGYERAIGVSGDGTISGVFEWSTELRRWTENTSFRPPDVRVEAGVGNDPLLFFSLQHGYVQLSLAHSLSGLSQSCGSTLFVRLLNELSPTRTLADDALEKFACRAEQDAYGDPVILQPPDGCGGDDQCPGESVCRDDVCLISYACANDAACPDDHRCDAGACVRVVSGSCDDAADCSGLVCEAGSCVACSESGARACASGRYCAPDGSCRDPDTVGEESGGEEGASEPGKVRGGAFSCASTSSRARVSAWLLALLAAPLLVRARRRRRVLTSRAGAGEETP
jgi:hypothetical protein